MRGVEEDEEGVHHEAEGADFGVVREQHRPEQERSGV